MPSLCEYKKLNIRYKVIDVKVKCDLKKNDIINLNKLLPKNLCLSMLHTAYPYYNTLLDDGWFKWERNKDSVIAKCPNPDGVIMEIIRDENNNIVIKVFNKGVNCPMNYGIGTVFNIPSEDLSKICFKLFDVVYPFSFIAKDKSTIARYATSDNEVLVKVLGSE